MSYHLKSSLTRDDTLTRSHSRRFGGVIIGLCLRSCHCQFGLRGLWFGATLFGRTWCDLLGRIDRVVHDWWLKDCLYEGLVKHVHVVLVADDEREAVPHTLFLEDLVVRDLLGHKRDHIYEVLYGLLCHLDVKPTIEDHNIVVHGLANLCQHVLVQN